MCPMTTDAAEAVRRYLLFLENPDSMRDEEAIEAAQRKVEAATDPLEKLFAVAERDKLSRVDGDHYRREFITYAKAYATQHAIPGSAFAELGVPQADLVDAGLAEGRRGASRSSSSTTASGAPRQRARRVTQDEVREVALAMGDAFSIRMLAEAAETTQATASKVVKALEDDGTVVPVGADKAFGGRGKPPMLYRVK